MTRKARRIMAALHAHIPVSSSRMTKIWLSTAPSVGACFELAPSFPEPAARPPALPALLEGAICFLRCS